MFKVLECRVPPPVVAALHAVAMWGLAKGLPAGHVNLPGVVGPTLAGVGIAIAASGVWAFRVSQTTIDPRDPRKTAHLVTHGVYRFSRNPMYLGMLLVLLGWGLWLRHLPAALVPALFVAYMSRFQIQPEERALREKFGEAFRDYAARVRRWA